MTNTQRNIAAASFLIFLAGLGITTFLIKPDAADTGHIVGGALYDSGVVPTECGFWTVRGPSAVWESFGLEIPDGGSGLALAKVCYSGSDGGDPGAQELPSGIEWIDGYVRPYVAGESVFEVWVATHPGAPWRCACAATVNDAGPCLHLGEPVEDGRPLLVNDWSGGCALMPCGTWSGVDPFPPACKAVQCAGRECGSGYAGGSCGVCAEGQVCTDSRCVPAPPGLDAGAEDAGEDAGG
jgi:hypothetical protein